MQDKENSSQKDSLNYISESIENLNSRNKLLKTKIDQFKSRNEDLEQRMLKVNFSIKIINKSLTILTKPYVRINKKNKSKKFKAKPKKYFFVLVK